MRRLFSRLFDSGVHVSCSNICVTLSNIPYLPFTKRAALRCTISSLSELYFWWGCQTVALYSRKDLTREKYAVSLSFSGQPFMLRLRKDNLEFAFDVMTSSMCFVHSKSSLTVTPRYLASFTSSSTCPDNSCCAYLVDLSYRSSCVHNLPHNNLCKFIKKMMLVANILL